MFWTKLTQFIEHLSKYFNDEAFIQMIAEKVKFLVDNTFKIVLLFLIGIKH